MKTNKLLAILVSVLLLAAVACAPTTSPTKTEAPAATAEAAATEQPAATEAPAETEAPVAAETVKVAALKGPTGMGLAYLMEENEGNYQVDIYDAPDAITGKFVSGEVDIAAVPINLASVLNKKLEGAVRMLAVDTLGVLYIIDTTDTVKTMADLAGKTVYATGQGSTPEYVLSDLLAANGLADKVTVEFVGEHAALAAMLASGEAEIGMLPEPNVSSVLLKNEQAKIALDLNAAWEESTGLGLVQGCYIASADFVSAHPEAAKRFLTDCAASVDKVNSEADAADVIVKQGILPAVPVAKMAIPNANIVCITGDEMKTLASGMLSSLFAANPASVGGALPEDAFYYMG